MTVHPDDRPDPLEQPIRARVPDKVAGGCFSTGVIVMTAQTEFVLDFVQNLGRPHQIVARVVMPHSVLPQLVDALGRNMQLYKGRWGDLPQPPLAASVQVAGWGKPVEPSQTGGPGQSGLPGNPAPPPVENRPPQSAAPPGAGPTGDTNDLRSGSVSQPASSQQAETDSERLTPLEQQPSTENASESTSETAHHLPPASSNVPPSSETQPSITPDTLGTPVQPMNTGQGIRQATAQEIYDDLKIRDELLSGVYANAVMIGHGPHEFSFDFITNFYPNSAVSARVFMAAGQIPRLYDSLRGTWEQLKLRMQPPPENPPPGWVV